METKKPVILQRGSVKLTCSYGKQNRINQMGIRWVKKMGTGFLKRRF